MTKRKKTLKIILVVLVILLALVIAAGLILPKPLAMGVYNDNFGKRFTSDEALTWTIEDFDGLQRDR